jgi:metal-responsive CopG/Arc/MetJ family transcriptional regulator
MRARTMVYLEPELLEALRERARKERVSLAELVRRLVKAYLDDRHRPVAIAPEAYSRIVALGSSGHRDASERHDACLAEAVRRDHAH